MPNNEPKVLQHYNYSPLQYVEEFYNSCHSPEDGKFCGEDTGHGKPGWHNPDNYGSYNISMEPEDVDQSEKHYGRKENAPEMGGIQWAYEGQSPPITSAAEDVLQGNDYDPYDRYLDYNRDQYEAADTILKTIENESSDVTLYSGHRRDRETIDAILKEGVAFPLVATSPSKELADSYAEAWRDPSDLSAAIVYEFPPGSQAGFYRFNEHIATGEYGVESYKWSDDKSVIDIKLRQTKRSTVPEKKPLYEEED
jgi:hypothetical protein